MLEEEKKDSQGYVVESRYFVNLKNGSEISLDNADKALKELGLSATIGKE